MREKPGKKRSIRRRVPAPAGDGTRSARRVLAEIPEGAADTELEHASEDVLGVQLTPEQQAPKAPERVEGRAGRVRSGRTESKPQYPEGTQGRERTGELPDRHRESRVPANARDGAPRPEDGEERLTLPPGGLVAMRRSGGLRFTSRNVVVYKDGRVEADWDQVLGSTRTKATRKLSDQEMAELYRVLDGINFAELPTTAGRPNPDAYAYEIVDRIGGRDFFVEAFDGSIPEQLSPLIRLLSAFMRERL